MWLELGHNSAGRTCLASLASILKDQTFGSPAAAAAAVVKQGKGGWTLATGSTSSRLPSPGLDAFKTIPGRNMLSYLSSNLTLPWNNQIFFVKILIEKVSYLKALLSRLNRNGINSLSNLPFRYCWTFLPPNPALNHPLVTHRMNRIRRKRGHIIFRMPNKPPYSCELSDLSMPISY